MASRPSPGCGRGGRGRLILVDLPLEHAGEIDRQLREHGMHLIRMSAPTSEDSRLADTLRDAGGFVYHIMLAGDRGRAAGRGPHRPGAGKVRAHTGLPVAAGFGVRTQSRVVGRHADLVAVGSRLAEVLAERGVPGALENAAAGRRVAAVGWPAGIRASERAAGGGAPLASTP